MTKKYLESGKIVGTHGVRGEMRVQPWADDTEFLLSFKKLYLDKDGFSLLEITSARVHGNIVLVKAKGIDSIEAAEKLRNRTVFIDRTDAKLDGSYFIQDIIGCEVFDSESGKKLGVVSDVSETGANDVWHITRDKNEYLIPAIPEVVKSVDTDSGKIIITPLKGIFDDED